MPSTVDTIKGRKGRRDESIRKITGGRKKPAISKTPRPSIVHELARTIGLRK